MQQQKLKKVIHFLFAFGVNAFFLQGLNNSVFEELCVDVYDEVDRRETDQVGIALLTVNHYSPIQFFIKF